MGRPPITSPPKKESHVPVCCKLAGTWDFFPFELSIMQKQNSELVQFRDYTCAGYRRCLRTAALLDYPMDNCRKCQNRRHKIPVPSPIHNEMILDDAVNCTKLLMAIFHPERYYHAHAVRKFRKPPQDVSLARVEWL